MSESPERKNPIEKLSQLYLLIGDILQTIKDNPETLRDHELSLFNAFREARELESPELFPSEILRMINEKGFTKETNTSITRLI